MEYPLGVKFRYDSAPLLLEIPEVYSTEECKNFITRIEGAAPTIATNNPLYRNQDRVMFDDPVASKDLFSRIKHNLPQEIEGFTLKGINERLRCYRYVTGQKFDPHMDHWYQATDSEISLYSVLAYFNSDFEGGETRFMEEIEATIKPEIGKVAIFQHKVRHEGCEVTKGRKFAMRTDVMYEKS